MNIDTFISELKATLEAGDEATLLQRYLYFPANLAASDREYLETIAVLPFVSLYGKAISITYKRFSELAPTRRAEYAARSALVEQYEYILYLHYADASQETDNAVPVGRIGGREYQILW